MNRAPIKSLARRLISNVVLIAIALVIGMQAFKALAAAATKPKRVAADDVPRLVRMIEVERTQWTQAIRGYGRARAMHTVSVNAEIEGKVVFVHPSLEVGNRVAPDLEIPIPEGKEKAPYEKGTLVALDTADLESTISRLTNEISSLKADKTRLEKYKAPLQERLDLVKEERAASEAELQRIEGLVRDKRLTPSDLDNQRLQVLVRRRAQVDASWAIKDNEEAIKSLEDRIAAREVELTMAVRNKGRARIIAPEEGVVVRRHVQPFSQITKGAALVDYVSLREVEVAVALPAERYDEVGPGSTTRLYDAETGEELYKGPITRKAPTLNDAERTFYAYVVVDGTATSNPVPPGSFVRAEVDGRQFDDVVLLKREVFLGDAVFVAVPYTPPPPEAAKEGEEPLPPAPVSKEPLFKIERRTPVVTRKNPGLAVITGGLEPGELVVTTNQESLGKDSIVRRAPERAEKPTGKAK